MNIFIPKATLRLFALALLFISFAGYNFIRAYDESVWFPPAGSPATQNVAAPINVGTSDQIKNGSLSAKSLLGENGVVANHISIGGCAYGTQGSCLWPYETIQLPSNHNLRINFGDSERFILTNTGTLTALGDSQVNANKYCDISGVYCISSVLVNTSPLDGKYKGSAEENAVLSKGCMRKVDTNYVADQWMSCPMNYYVAGITDNDPNAQDVLCCPLNGPKNATVVTFNTADEISQKVRTFNPSIGSFDHVYTASKEQFCSDALPGSSVLTYQASSFYSPSDNTVATKETGTWLSDWAKYRNSFLTSITCQKY